VEIERLVAEARQGDADAFTGLVRRFQAMTFGYAYAILGEAQQAEDAIQQAFIVAYDNLPKPRQSERCGGWLRGVVQLPGVAGRRLRRGAGRPFDDDWGAPRGLTAWLRRNRVSALISGVAPAESLRRSH
jgi:RNA polymerase sigma-70 factor (ECF subfamily)